MADLTPDVQAAYVALVASEHRMTRDDAADVNCSMCRDVAALTVSAARPLIEVETLRGLADDFDLARMTAGETRDPSSISDQAVTWMTKVLREQADRIARGGASDAQ